ncbi:MAG: DMT family transporter [Clostridia bacterium]|nr:DMT family transporter [Clostridia bacterium]
MKTLKKPFAVLLLLGVTLIWGSGFTVIKMILHTGMSVGLINILRGSGLALLVLAFFGKKVFKMKKKDALVGIAAGLTNSLGYLFQSAGLKFTTPSVSAFLTILSTVFVPVIALVIYRVRPTWRLFPAVALSIVGTFFLTGMSFGNLRLGTGELLSVGCALSFAFSIAILSNTGEGVCSEAVVFWMGIMHGLGGTAYLFLFENGQIGTIDWTSVILPILYMVIVASFLATASQVVSQKSIDANTAAIIMTMEAVFGTLISLFAGYDRFAWSLVIGGSLIFCGVIMILLPKAEEMKTHFSVYRKRSMTGK